VAGERNCPERDRRPAGEVEPQADLEAVMPVAGMNDVAAQDADQHHDDEHGQHSQ
jgi:hypothetical protein